MDPELKQIFVQLERHVMPLIGSDSPQGLSKEESKVLALQHINRFNQKIGYLARSGKEDESEMKLLQTHVNNITVGLKYNNVEQTRQALASVRSLLSALEEKEQGEKKKKTS